MDSLRVILLFVFLITLSYAGTTVLHEINLSESFAGEQRWTIRHFGTNFNYPRVVRRMYTKGCGNSLYVSYTAINSFLNSTFGRIVRLESNGTAGYWKVVEEKSFPECNAMFDIALTSGCTQLYALCRRNRPFPNRYLNESISATLSAINAAKDLMWEFDPPPFANGFRHPNVEVYTKDFLMLYKFATNSPRSAVTRYIIHRGMGGGVGNAIMEIYSNNQLLHFYTQAEMCVVTNPTNCHSGDSAFTIDLAKMSFDYRYGDDWAIGGGHPFMQRLSSNPSLGRVLQVGATDLSTIYFRLDNQKRGTGSVKFNMYQQMKWRGGPGGVTPTPTGWIATLCNAVTPEGNGQQLNQGIGLVFLDRNATVIKVKWVVNRTGSAFLGHPNIINLPNGRFLLGWAEQYGLTPEKYYLVEINSEGKMVTSIKELTEGGWGEQDAWTLFAGRPIFSFAWKKPKTPAQNGEYLGRGDTTTTKKLGITTHFP